MLTQLISVWKLPARIWSLKKRHVFATNSGGATRHRKTVCVQYRRRPHVIGVAFDAGMACVHVLFIRRVKCSAAAAISRKCLAVRNWRGGGNLRRSVLFTRQPDAHLPGEILLDFNLSDKTLLADSFQNWRDARLMFKPNLAAIGRLSETRAHQCGDGINQQTFAESTVHQRLTALASVLKLPEVSGWNALTSAIPWGNKPSLPVGV